MLFLYGKGRNGKSVFPDMLFWLWGDHARRASSDTVLSKQGGSHPTDIAGLDGARLVIGSELPRGKSWDESVFKDLTGGDVMTARFMHRDFLDFMAGRPSHYHQIRDEMAKIKAAMKHPDTAQYVTHGLHKNTTIELYQAGNDGEPVKAVTGHSGAEMLKKHGGRIRQQELAPRAQEARNRFERNRGGT